MRILRIPSLLLAAALQVLPIVRAALPAAESAASVLAIVFRWAAGAAAALGGVQAVSGASTVITNPLSTNIVQGQPITLRLTTAPDQAHYWTASGLPTGLSLSGTSGQTLWTITGTPTVTGTYNVGLTAKDQASSKADRTVTATLVINISAGTARPAITSQPASRTVIQGQSASFSVTATGTAPLSYQWRFNSANLAGQTTSNLVINPATTNNSGNYTVVVTNNSGSVTSAVATLTVNVLPAITTQPLDQTVTQGQTATFNVVATGTAPLTYFWRQGATLVSKSASPSLAIPNAQLSAAGAYSVIVSNVAGTVTSAAATLTVNPAPQPPFISSPPGNMFVPAAGTATFAVSAGGTAPLFYQWYFSNAPLSGETGTTLALSNVQLPDAGNYFVVVTNAYGSATSSVATLTLVQPPVITSQPQSRTNVTGSTPTFTVAATSAGPLAYQWRRGGANLADNGHYSGVSSSMLSIASVQTNDAGNYTVVITNVAGAVTSQVAALTVTLPPVVLAPLVVQISGSGSVNPNYNGQLLAIGTQYTMTAIPGVGYRFANWTGSFTAGSPTLNFVMQSNLVLRANFVAASFAGTQGKYNGLYFDPAGVSVMSSGGFAATTTASGRYSASLILLGVKYSFSGQFSPIGLATNIVARKGLSTPLTVELELDLSGADMIRGRVTDGSWAAQLLADRLVFDRKTNPAPQAGAYTLVIPGTPGATQSPAGDGFGSVIVDGSGTVRFKGTLADGTKLTQTTSISKSGDWPCFGSLPTRSGSILGWLAFTNRPADDINGRLAWTRMTQPSTRFYPAGFSVETDAIGSRYTPQVSGARVLSLRNGRVLLTDGGLTQNISRPVSRENSNSNHYSDGDHLALSISPATGLFQGSAIDPATGAKISFRGAVLSDRNLGSGFFLGAGQSGRVYFGP